MNDTNNNSNNHNREMIDIEWWERAAREAPVAIAFINKAGDFLFVNKEWSILTGYSPEELIDEKSCHDLIVSSDRDYYDACIKEVNNGKIIDFFLKLNLIRIDGTTIPVGTYAHRQPTYGVHKGYIICAKRHGAADMIALQNSFENLQNAVTLSEHIAKEFAVLGEKVSALYDKSNSLEDVVNSLVSKGDSKINIGSHTTGGDFIGNDKTGRDKNSMLIIGLVVLCVVLLGALFLDRSLLITKDKAQVGSEIQEVTNPTK